MNKCVYTIRFGQYDASHEPPKSDGWDYIVFSDREIESDVWETRIVRTPLGKEYNFMNARYVYINSHRFVPEYDFSLMVGGQIHINGDLNEFFEQYIDLDADFNMMKHPCRTCIYQEGAIVEREGIDKTGNVAHQMAKYRADGFPEDYGLNACGIIGRKNTEFTKCFEQEWFHQVMTGSYRDQLSFDYVRWKLGGKVHNFGYWETLNSEFFSVHQHGTGNRITG